MNNGVSQRNPALVSFVKALQNDYQIVIVGKERSFEEAKAPGIKYIGNHRLVKLLDLLHEILRRLLKLSGKNLGRRVSIYIHVYLYNFLSFFRLFFLKFDLVLCLETEALENSKRLKFFFRKPVAYFIYEIYAQQVVDTDHRLKKLMTNIERKGLTHADIIIGSVNDVLGNYLLKEYGLEDKELISFTICPDNPGIWSALDDYDKRPVRFYYHGALFINRGLENAILAMKDIDNAELYYRGFGNFEEHLKQLVAENNLEHKVFFLDPVDTRMLTVEATQFDVGLTMARMNVANHLYACGFKTFENTAAGTALIVPASYPLIPFIEKYQNGFVYQDATVENMQQAFKYCIENRHLINTWKINSRKAYEQEYNPAVQAWQLVDTFFRYI